MNSSDPKYEKMTYKLWLNWKNYFLMFVQKEKYDNSSGGKYTTFSNVTVINSGAVTIDPQKQLFNSHISLSLTCISQYFDDFLKNQTLFEKMLSYYEGKEYYLRYYKIMPNQFLEINDMDDPLLIKDTNYIHFTIDN